MEKYPHVSVIVVNWNGLEDTIDCLNSFTKVSYPDFSLVVVDNGSRTNEAAILEKEYKGKFQHFECIRLENNLGYAAGCNVGIRYARKKFNPPYFLIMNNDVIVHPNFLTNLVLPAEANKAVGLCGPKIFHYPEYNKIWWAGTYKISIGWWMKIKVSLTETTGETDALNGCCTLIKSEVVERIGLFIPAFFLSGHDINEFGFRAKKSGFKLLYVPSAVIWHKFGRASLKINLITRFGHIIKGALLIYSGYGKKYHLPSAIAWEILYFLRELIKSLALLPFDKRRRESFRFIAKNL